MIITGSVIVLVALGAIALIWVGVTKWGDSRPIKHETAKVVAKRSATNGYPAGLERTVSMQYFATFELPSGRRMELLVQSREFGLMAEGDKGTLSRRGRRYLGFDRERG